ncbi:MAG: cell division protein ZipA [Paraglaciecola sp.]|jgi:cell division protein ZipA
MEDVLRWSLFILGTCAIAGVLIHGLWVSRKSSSKNKTDGKASAKHRFSGKSVDGGARKMVQPSFSLDDDLTAEKDADGSWPSADEPVDLDSEQFDELGLGSPRVVNSQEKAQHGTVQDSPAGQSADVVPSDDTDPVPAEDTVAPAKEPDKPYIASASKIYASVVTQPKPEYTATKSGTYGQSAQDVKKASSLPEPPNFLLKKTADKPGEPESLISEHNPSASDKPQEGKSSVQHKASLAEQARNMKYSRQAESARGKRQEPKLTEDQLDIDFENDEAESQQKVQSQSQSAASEPPAQEVLVLNVKAPDDQPILGSALLPMLLTLGFKFGDQDIFHRHVNANGKGAVLFSLANMFKPGVFDIDSLENFTTQGVSLFMILPIEGDPHQVFNMMHNAARKIADEFHGQILDGRRSVLSKQGLQQYVERIRDFERKRLTNR